MNGKLKLTSVKMKKQAKLEVRKECTKGKGASTYLYRPQKWKK